MTKTIFRGLTLLGLIYGTLAAGTANFSASGLWHFDGNMNEELGTGSSSSPYEGYDWAGPENTHSGSSALDLTDPGYGMQYISLNGDAQINGSTGFGIAMWVKRTGINDDYNSIFGFGNDSLFQLRVTPWYDLNNGWYKFYSSTYGTIPSNDPAESFIKTPLNTWSFIAVFVYSSGGQNYIGLYSADPANGETCTNSAIPLPAGAVLDGSNTLWLGGIAGSMRNSKVFIDELVISNQPCDIEWARAVYDATKNGENLFIVRNCGDLHRYGLGIPGDVNVDCKVNGGDFALLAENWGQQNDPNALYGEGVDLLRITMTGDDWTLSQNQLNQRTFTVRETPLLGGMMANTLMDDSRLRQVFQDLRDHNCNTVLIRETGILNGSAGTQRFIDTAHRMSLQVYAIPHPPLPTSLLTEHPEITMLDQYGQSMGVPCPLSGVYQSYVLSLWDPNVIATSKIDGFMIDEPTFPQWRMSFDEGRLGCYCPECQARYQAMYGTAMPVINLPLDYGSTNFNRVIAFRKAMFTQWMTFLCDHLRAAGKDFNVSIVFSPDVVSIAPSSYLLAKDATSVDVNAVISLANLDTLSVDPYWNAWNMSPSWYASFIPQFCTAPHQAGKGSIFWVQAYLESESQIERGLHAGEVTTAINNSLGLGADGVYFWLYEGFSQTDYSWPQYFDEFATAVTPYLDQPAEGMVIEPVQPASQNFAVTPLGSGTYQVQMDPNAPGAFGVTFKNRAGIVRTLTFTAE